MVISLDLEATAHFRMGRRLWGAKREIDVLATQKPTRKRLGIECKYQGTPGSAEEKLDSTISDMRSWPIPGIIVLDGDGFSDHFRHYALASGKAVLLDDLELWLRLFFGLEVPA